jgi:hypothetical protein
MHRSHGRPCAPPDRRSWRGSDPASPRPARRFALALLLGACGSATDDRPPTLEFITETILAPSCASAACHSSFKREVGDAFDTPENARLTIVANSLVVLDEQDDPDASFLIRSLTVGVPSILDPGSGNVRMPYDTALPDADIELIRAWIREGIPGAQCVANAQDRGCSVTREGDRAVYRVVECVDGNIERAIETCSGDEICTVRSGNGQCVDS